MLWPRVLPYRGYWVFFGSSLVALDDVSLELVEPLLEVEPPEDAFSLSLSASLAAELEELVLGWLEAPDDGLVALDDEELGELGLVALGELGGMAGVVDEELLLEPGAGAVEARSRSLSPQAARPRAIATAIANVESLMCSSRLDTNRQASKVRTACKPLM